MVWGGVHEHQSVRGVWNVALQQSHIHFLELSGVPLLETFPSVPHGSSCPGEHKQHDVVFINRQWGLCSHQLHMLVCRQILWCGGRLLSLRATHVPRDDQPALQGCTSVQGMDSALGICGTDMDLLRSSHIRSVCIKGKCTGARLGLDALTPGHASFFTCFPLWPWFLPLCPE